MIEHVMSAVMCLCERVIVLHHGEQIATGTPDEIRRNPDVISAYLGKSTPTGKSARRRPLSNYHNRDTD